MTDQRPVDRGLRFIAGHLVAAGLACALTVSIVGSIAYMGIEYYRRRDEARKVSEFVASLEHRNKQELAYIVDELKRRRGLASRVVPTILKAARRDNVYYRQIAAIEVSSAFIDDQRVEKAILALSISLY